MTELVVSGVIGAGTIVVGLWVRARMEQHRIERAAKIRYLNGVITTIDEMLGVENGRHHSPRSH